MRLKSLCIVACLAVLALSAVLVPASPARAQRPLRIAMVLWRGETPTEAGFRDELERMGYDAAYTVRDAGLDEAALEGILKDVAQGGYDYVYTQGTAVSLAARKILDKNTPIVFTLVRFPKKSALVKELDAPGGNITGVSSQVPPADILRTARELFAFSSLAVVLNVTQADSRQELLALERASADLPIRVASLGYRPDGAGLDWALKAAGSPDLGADLLYFGPDPYLIAHRDRLAGLAALRKVPSIGVTEEIVRAGALFGIVPDYETMGRQAAYCVDRGENGARLGSLPVAMPKKLTGMVNARTLKALGLTLPESALQRVQMVE